MEFTLFYGHVVNGKVSLMVFQLCINIIARLEFTVVVKVLSLRSPVSPKIRADGCRVFASLHSTDRTLVCCAHPLATQNKMFLQKDPTVGTVTFTTFFRRKLYIVRSLQMTF